MMAQPAPPAGMRTVKGPAMAQVAFFMKLFQLGMAKGKASARETAHASSRQASSTGNSFGMVAALAEEVDFVGIAQIN